MLPGYKTKTRPLWKTAKLFLGEGGLTLISSMKSTEKINFTELAQKVNVKNKKGKWNVKTLTSQQ